jgi:hypothetical protein
MEVAMNLLQITTKLELNMLVPHADARTISDFAIKNRCPAIVISPEFAPMMLTDRSAKNGQYKLIAAIDFPEGRNFCYDKFNQLDVMSLEVEGMDIILTKGRTDVESKNEAKSLQQFLKGSINPILDTRYVLGCYCNPWEDVEKFLNAAKEYPPDAIRIDQHLDLPNIGLKHHLQTIAKLRKFTPKPLKISGNLDLQTIEKLLAADKNLRFDVSISQAIGILNQAKQREEVKR